MVARTGDAPARVRKPIALEYMVATVGEIAAAVYALLEREGAAPLDRVVLAVDAGDWGAGVRVLEEPVAAGRHRLVVSALDASGAVIVERPVSVRL